MSGWLLTHKEDGADIGLWPLASFFPRNPIQLNNFVVSQFFVHLFTWVSEVHLRWRFIWSDYQRANSELHVDFLAILFIGNVSNKTNSKLSIDVGITIKTVKHHSSGKEKITFMKCQMLAINTHLLLFKYYLSWQHLNGHFTCKTYPIPYSLLNSS